MHRYCEQCCLRFSSGLLKSSDDKTTLSLCDYCWNEISDGFTDDTDILDIRESFNSGYSHYAYADMDTISSKFVQLMPHSYEDNVALAYGVRLRRIL